MAKLTDLQRKEIIERRQKGESLTILAKEFQVSKAYICQIAGAKERPRSIEPTQSN